MCMKQHLGWGLHEDNTDCQTLCFASVQSEPPQRRLHLTGAPHVLSEHSECMTVVLL